MSVVGRLNARAKRERAVYVSRRQLEVVRQYDADAGYDGNRLRHSSRQRGVQRLLPISTPISTNLLFIVYPMHL